MTGAEPDAYASGWVAPQGQPREDSVFVLAADQLGIGQTSTVGPAVWIDLADVVNVDALGDPHEHRQVVELSLDDGRVITADWPESFVAVVLDALMRIAATASGPRAVGGAPPPGAAAGPVTTGVRPPVSPFDPLPPGAAPVPATPSPDPVPPAVGPTAAAPSPPALAPPGAAPLPAAAVPPTGGPRPGEPSSTPSPGAAPTPVSGSDTAPVAPMFGSGAAPVAPPEPASGPASVPAPGAPPGAAPVAPPAAAPPPAAPAVGSAAEPGPAATLVLEDVVYLGGYPGHGKKRKKCVASLDRTGLEVKGPGGTSFRLDWDAVRSIEAQNADEARFRMNAKIHRDATALVLECQQDVTVLLEARDCPTVPLRSAIAQLVDGLRVVVV